MPTSFATPAALQARIYYVPPSRVGRLSGLNGNHETKWERLIEQAGAMGFNCLLSGPLYLSTTGTALPDDPDRPDPWLDDSHSLLDCLVRLASLCAAQELSLWLDLQISPLAKGEGLAAWSERLSTWVQVGVSGFRCHAPHTLAARDWQALMQTTRAARPDCRFLAWTPGLTPEQLRPLADAGFDATFLSLPWWDYRAPWLAEEHARLRAIGAVIAMAGAPDGPPNFPGQPSSLARQQHALRALWTAAVLGDGLLIPMGLEYELDIKTLTAVNRWHAQQRNAPGRLHFLQGANASYTALVRTEKPGAGPNKSAARLLTLNPDQRNPVKIDWLALQPHMPDGYALIRPWSAQADRPSHTPPGQDKSAGRSTTRAFMPTLLPEHLNAGAFCLVHVLPATVGLRAPRSTAEQRSSAAAALLKPRIAIENITPCVDGGAYPLKRTLAEEVAVQADVFMDGHERIAVQLLWRSIDEDQWRHVPMTLADNDRWHASFRPLRLGRHEYAVQAWRDTWATYCDELQKKTAANLDVSVEVEEGRALIASALGRATGQAPETEHVLSTTLQHVGIPETTKPVTKRPRSPDKTTSVPTATPDQIEALLSVAVAQAMQTVDTKPFLSRSAITYSLIVERQAARYSSWYELFPRSQSLQPGRHGTFLDVARRFPAIRDMGFDVVYFPPIHPIGLRNRKGKNNAVTAAADEPGSPYAIGSSQGGHDAIHPELGTLDDFRQLLALARDHELEIALDFAIQCSPDHPWLAQHPAWFDWRADGSLRYAENPPKRYEDIVNVDFYGASDKRQSRLWTALRDVVLFWANNGVRLFRVDNPHTKPLPFWEWMIADVQSRHPDVLFLSEAFTRPKMMYRLAKIGFSQSYTYFTWRNTKQELTDYLTELNASPARDIFRPHFFVNTPDINPYFLQTSGRPGFLIRAALAASLSGLWGMYNGFELCEARALPGKEEYLDSEKYEIRAWDWNSPGNITAEISQLNRIRRSNPALQTHLGLRFHYADNDQVIFFSKATPRRDNVVLAAISLNPHAEQTATLELPLWEFGLPDDGALDAEDLFNGYRFTWHGKYQPVLLTRQRPFALWRVSAPERIERSNAL